MLSINIERIGANSRLILTMTTIIIHREREREQWPAWDFEFENWACDYKIVEWVVRLKLKKKKLDIYKKV